jgi:glycosyltransferase involved in cell wall biosynthesis
MGSTTVAVVIPSYNHAHHLDRALASVFAQTVQPADIVVVDDGSTDNLAEVVERHPDVRLIRQNNQGLAAARNTGWRACRSDYVVFLDADDRFKPEAIALNLAQFAETPGCGLVYGAYSNVDADTGRERVAELRPPGDDAFAAFLRANIVAMHATVMYPRSVLESVGGFDPGLRAAEDYDLYLRIAFDYPVRCRHEVLAEYVHHGANMSLNSGMMMRAVLQVLQAQRARARTRPDWSAAYRQGERDWRLIYARRWAQAWRAAAEPDQLRALTHQAGIIARLAPLELALVILAPTPGLRQARRAVRALASRLAGGGARA